jgi:putative transposase
VEVTRPRRRYATDLTDREWALLAPLIPPPKPGGRPAVHDRRELVDAMLYWLRSGCAWRLLPHDFPPWQTVYHYWRLWRQQGLWERVLAALREQERSRQGRNPTPTAVILDSQSVKTTEKGGPRGDDGAKKLSGRKRHLLVDTLGLVCKAHVTPADVGDRDGAVGLLRRLDRRRFPRLAHGWADQGDRGAFLAWVQATMGITLAVVRRADGGRRRRWLPPGVEPPLVPAFAVVPRRWVWSGPSAGWAGFAASARTTSSCRPPRRRDLPGHDPDPDAPPRQQVALFRHPLGAAAGS